MSFSAIKLAEAHEKGLEKKEAALAELREQIAELAAEADEKLALWLRSNPSASPDVTTGIPRLRERIDELVGREQRLASEVQAQRRIADEITTHANAEREAISAKANAAKEKQAVEDLANAWTDLVKKAEAFEAAWEGVVELAQVLDQLPSGEHRNGVLPTNLSSALQMALAIPGQEPFANSPRIVARRLPTTGGSRATDTRGFAGTLRELGDY